MMEYIAVILAIATVVIAGAALLVWFIFHKGC